MAGITTTTEFDKTVNTINAKIRYTMQDKGVFPNCVDRASLNKGTRSWTEPKAGTVTAYDLTEGVDMAQAQQLSDTLITITPAEIGCQVLISDILKHTRSSSVEDVAAKVMSNALLKACDIDGTEQMDNFSTSLGSGSSTTATPGYLGAARSRIMGNTTEPFQDETPIIVIHPYTYNDLYDIFVEGKITTTSSGAATQMFGLSGLSEEFARKYVIGNIAGMPVITDANFAISSNAAKGGVFVKSAIVYVEMWPAKVEPQRNGSLRGDELNATMCYAYGERSDYGGVELNLGATAPTA